MDNGLKTLLAELEITPAELAKLAGIPRQTVYNIHSGARSINNMSVQTFAAIAGALDMTLEELWDSVRETEDNDGRR